MKTLIIHLIIYIFLFLHISESKESTQFKIDSILKEIKYKKNDTLKVNMLNEASFLCQVEYPKNGVNLGFQSLKLAKKLNYKKGVANSFLRIGSNYLCIGLYDSTLHFYQKSLDLNKELNDTSAIIDNLSYIANLYSVQSNYIELKKYLEILIDFFKKIDNKQKLAEEYNNVGLVNLYLSNYNEALRHFQKSYILNKQINDSLGFSYNLVNTGRVYLKLGDYNKAIDNLQNGYEYFNKSFDNYNKSRILHFLSEIYINKNNLDSALLLINTSLNYLNLYNGDTIYGKQIEKREYSNCLIKKSKILLLKKDFIAANEVINQSIEFNKKNDYKEGLATSFFMLSKLKLFQMENEEYNIEDRVYNLNHILKYSKKADKIFKQVGELQNRSENLKIISDAYSKLDVIDSSFFYYKLYDKLQDSLYNTQNSKELGRLESDHKYKLKLIKNQEKAKLANAQIRFNKERINYLVVSLIFLLLIIIILIIVYVKRKKVYNELELKSNFIENQKVELFIKNNQLDKINLAKDKIFVTISHDLRNSVKGFKSMVNNFQNSKLNLPLRKDFELLDESATKLDNLLESLMDFADKEFYQIEFNYETFDMSILVDEIISSFTNQIKLKELNIIKEYNYRLANTNYNYALIIIRNIFHNAVKFSFPKSNIKINIFQEDTFTILTIEDSGIGISIEDIEKINNFIRPTPKMPIGQYEKGNSFGLIATKERIEKVGGSLYIESEIGKGTKVIIYFPQ